MIARALCTGLLPLIAAVSACGPVPVDQAEQSCLRDAEMAERPRGSIAVGVGSGGGGYGAVQMQIGGDYLRRRDPSDVFNDCVQRRSGKLPERPLSEQPAWWERI